MSILIAHPTRQHSHRLAHAMQDAGLLHSYWTLLPDRRALAWLPVYLLPSAVSRHSLGFLPDNKVHALAGPLLFQKLVLRFPLVAVRQFGEWLAWAVFDRWVAKQLHQQRPGVVVCYEMCCAETFRVAKASGIICVLDAAACHYAMRDKIFGAEGYGGDTWAGKRLRQRKQEEITLADRIICVSELARQSYIDAGVDADRIVVNTLGCDITKFAPRSDLLRTGAPRFVFVGMPVNHKGFDLLVANYKRLLAHYHDAELHVVGDPVGLGELAGDSRIHIHGKLPHDRLGTLLAQMDCTVLPSRLDSFGMVVVESLAAGVPVIVSDHVGASEAIMENKNGWVVPAGDEEALFQRMLVCCENVEKVRLMKTACADSARLYDWSFYSRRAVEIFSRLSGNFH